VGQGARPPASGAGQGAGPRRGAVLHRRGVHGQAAASRSRQVPGAGPGEVTDRHLDRLSARTGLRRARAVRQGAAASRAGVRPRSHARLARLLRRLPPLSQGAVPGRPARVPRGAHRRSHDRRPHPAVRRPLAAEARAAGPGRGRDRADRPAPARLAADRPGRAAQELAGLRAGNHAALPRRGQARRLLRPSRTSGPTTGPSTWRARTTGGRSASSSRSARSTTGCA